MDTRNIPDSLWLSILSYLDLRSLLYISQVCRHFYRLSSDRLFWQRIDLSTIKNLKITNLHKLLKSERMVNVKSLRWEGYLRRHPGFVKNTKKPSQPEAMTMNTLKIIKEKCPNLKELHLTYADLNKLNLNLDEYPTTLTYLDLEGSIISFDFFSSLENLDVLPNLVGLDLCDVHNLSSLSRSSVPAILNRRNLQTLLIKNCFKLSPEHVLQIPLQLCNLQVLNVSQLTVVDDEFCFNLSRHCDHLRDLDISFCYRVSDQGIFNLTSNIEKTDEITLRRLDLTEIALTDKIFSSLEKMPRLEYVNLIKTRCTSEGLYEYSRRHPKCFLDHKYSESSKKIGGSFWILNLERDNVEPMEH